MIKICLFLILIYEISCFSLEITQYTVDKCGKTCAELRSQSGKEYEDICYEGCDYARNMTSCTKCDLQYLNMPAKIYACRQGCQSYNHSQIITRSDSPKDSDINIKGHSIQSDMLTSFIKHFLDFNPFKPFTILKNATSGGDVDERPEPVGITYDDIWHPNDAKPDPEPQPMFPFGAGSPFDVFGLKTSSVAKKGPGFDVGDDEPSTATPEPDKPRMRIFIFGNPLGSLWGGPKRDNATDQTAGGRESIFKPFFPLHFFGPSQPVDRAGDVQPEGEDRAFGVERAHHDTDVQVLGPLGQPIETPKVGDDQIMTVNKLDDGPQAPYFASPSFVSGARDTVKTFIGCLKNLRFPPWFLFVSGMLLITLFLWLLISMMIYSKKSNRKMQKLYLSDSLDYILPYQDEKPMENKELILEPALPVKIPVEKI